VSDNITERELIYKTIGDVALRVHIFAPLEAATAPRPAIVFFFGGGWVIDDYPLYVMHVYGDAPPVSAVAVRDSSALPAFACSLFAAFGDAETRLYGRNFDWDYSPALLLYAHPDNGYDSVSMVDLGFYFSEADGDGGPSDVRIGYGPALRRGPVLDPVVGGVR